MKGHYICHSCRRSALKPDGHFVGLCCIVLPRVRSNFHIKILPRERKACPHCGSIAAKQQLRRLSFAPPVQGRSTGGKDGRHRVRSEETEVAYNKLFRSCVIVGSRSTAALYRVSCGLASDRRLLECGRLEPRRSLFQPKFSRASQHV